MTIDACLIESEIFRYINKKFEDIERSQKAFFLFCYMQLPAKQVYSIKYSINYIYLLVSLKIRPQELFSNK